MIVYWFILSWSFIIGLFWRALPRRVTVDSGRYEIRTNIFIALLVFGIIIFFMGLRSGIADTGAYITYFNSLPSSLSEAISTDVEKDKGFYLFSVFIKQFISVDFHVWLFIIALISGICVMLPLYKYSTMFELSAFLFIATCQFTWMLNGMRQFIAISILFMCMHLIIERKFILYCLITILLSTIHGSALIMIPFYFIAQSKPWNKKILITIVSFGLAFVFFDDFLNTLTGLLDSTQYDGYNQAISGINGSSIFRLIIAFIPCILAFVMKEKITKLNDSVLNLCINMSVVNACFFLLSTAGGGIFIGRMAAYFDIYNLLLYPILFSKVFDKKTRRILYFFCIVGYIGFFYYQMVVTWNLYYVSDVLDLYLFSN